jgi:S1-C subfamily serine protease
VVRVLADTRLVGSQVLERFVLTFDAGNRRVRMAPESDEPVLFEPVRGPGFALHPRQAVAEVIEVFPGSPAETAGIRAGDLLRTIDGTHVAERGCVSLGDDSARTFGFERDGERFEIAIEPAVLVP